MRLTSSLWLGVLCESKIQRLGGYYELSKSLGWMEGSFILQWNLLTKANMCEDICWILKHDIDYHS